MRRLDEVEPGERAVELAGRLGKDPRLVELVLGGVEPVRPRGARGADRRDPGGWICANAGIDASNVPGDETVVLLPEDPDASARHLRAAIAAACGRRPAVVIADSFGRPWRIGQADVAIGCAGLRALDDWRGRTDAHGRELTATVVAIADELAAAADLARDKASGGPAVLVRGAGPGGPTRTGRAPRPRSSAPPPRTCSASRATRRDLAAPTARASRRGDPVRPPR